jgi:hypothetical protein
MYRTRSQMQRLQHKSTQMIFITREFSARLLFDCAAPMHGMRGLAAAGLADTITRSCTGGPAWRSELLYNLSKGFDFSGCDHSQRPMCSLMTPTTSAMHSRSHSSSTTTSHIGGGSSSGSATNTQRSSSESRSGYLETVFAPAATSPLSHMAQRASSLASLHGLKIPLPSSAKKRDNIFTETLQITPDSSPPQLRSPAGIQAAGLSLSGLQTSTRHPSPRPPSPLYSLSHLSVAERRVIENLVGCLTKVREHRSIRGYSQDLMSRRYLAIGG